MKRVILTFVLVLVALLAAAGSSTVLAVGIPADQACDNVSAAARTHAEVNFNGLCVERP